MLNGSELRNSWNSIKTQRTMSMTLEAWELLGDLATSAATSRSEVLEILIRNAKSEEMDLQEEKASWLLDKLI